MKIFISHSSGDKWVAQKISEEIQELGAETFLDAQNIVTGDDFDEEIRRQLAESDEILFIISATALRSQWVMMELGAARTMRKRLALILVGVSPNELPSPINPHQAREETRFTAIMTKCGPGWNQKGPTARVLHQYQTSP